MKTKYTDHSILY